MQGRRDHDARLRRRYGDLTTRSTDLLVNREGYVLIGDDAARAKPIDVPESGGEIAMDDGSLAVAEPLGQAEAYLVRRLASRRAGAAPAEALKRAEGRARELARKRAAPSHACEPGRAGEVESDLPSPGAVGPTERISGGGNRLRHRGGRGQAGSSNSTRPPNGRLAIPVRRRWGGRWPS